MATTASTAWDSSSSKVSSLSVHKIPKSPTPLIRKPNPKTIARSLKLDGERPLRSGISSTTSSYDRVEPPLLAPLLLYQEVTFLFTTINLFLCFSFYINLMLWTCKNLQEREPCEHLKDTAQPHCLHYLQCSKKCPAPSTV